MNIPVEDLTPKQIVTELERFIIGQDKAKRAVAIAMRNRYRRQRLPVEQRDEIIPKNILMIGPTGVGKTEIARRLAQLSRAPFIKVEATKFTEVGYVGRDVDAMVRDLLNIAIRMVEREKMDEVRPLAEERAVDRLVDILVKPKRARKEKVQPFEQQLRQTFGQMLGMPWSEGADGGSAETSEEEVPNASERRRLRRAKVREQILSGARDEEVVPIEVEESNIPFLQVFSPQGVEEMGMDAGNVFGGLPKQRTERRVTLGEARRILIEEESRKMIDTSQISRESIERVEQTGIIFLDELDKIAGRESGHGPDVSREGVQRDLLPIIEGSTVITKYGPVRTDYILFIAAGAFHASKPSDLIPELQGRLPIRVELESLTENDLMRILTEPQNALTKQYIQLLSTEDVELIITDDAIKHIAAVAADVNTRTENIGARRLYTILEKVLEDVLFEAPNLPDKKVVVDPEFVKRKLAGIADDVDMSRYIL